MEKTLYMGAFTELEEAWFTDVCGGSMPAWLQAGLGIVISSAIEASEAEKRANEAARAYYNNPTYAGSATWDSVAAILGEDTPGCGSGSKGIWSAY